MLRGKRDSTEILAEILRGAKGGNCKTRMIRRANTNHVRGTAYVEECLDAGLLRHRDGLYYLTEEGDRLLRHWREVEERLPEAAERPG